MKTELIDYSHQDTLLEGYCAYADDGRKKPLVLVAPPWGGIDHFIQEKVRDLAALGYAGFALDVYGKGVRGESKEDCAQLMSPLMENRFLLKERLLSGLEKAATLRCVDAEHIAALGYCFGGLCVLDMARSGMPLEGVVSFHGLLSSTPVIAKKAITSRILVLHGQDDPMVPPEQVQAFCQEMSDAKADWQMHIYGNTMHAFTHPKACDPHFGTVYNPRSDQHSWHLTQEFLKECFCIA